MEQTANQFLGREPVGRLMKKYAVPCIISLLVGALYNIVDQIFIANASYLGSYGNAANTVVFPLTVIALAIAVMIGDGCCAFVSLSLGKGEPDKARLNSKIELQPSRPPTGMCLVTAEYVPEILQSGLARYFIVEMKADDIDLALMTEYQQLAADGVLAAIMHSYVDWLRETYLCDENTFVQGLSDTFKKYRTEVTVELSARCDNFHTRVPDTLAHLMIGFDFLLAFLNAKEEIGVQDMENYKQSFRNIIVTSSVRNNRIVENENYSYQFCDKLKSLLDSGRCSVNVIGSDCDMNRKGFIGFEDDNYYYLIMNAAFSEVVKLSKEMGESFSIGKNSLIQQLVDDGIMVVKGKRNTTTVRVTDDRQMSVAVLDKSKMFADTEVPEIRQ